MADEQQLPALLDRAEHATFHDAPAQALALLEPALALATASGSAADAAGARWLLGVALAAAGRYGGALTALAPLVEAGRFEDAGEQPRRYAALAAATIASVHRQLGRHGVARACDLEALSLTDGTGEAAFDAELGLASDAIGLDESAEAAERLARAAVLLAEAPGERWRERVRLSWTTAELLLLDGRLDEAVEEALRALERARAAAAPLHVAKSLLILGLAQVSGGQFSGGQFSGGQGELEPAAPSRSAADSLPGAGADAAESFATAASLARAYGGLPELWPALALLGALVDEQDPAVSVASLAAAREVVAEIAGDLPPGVRSEWLARPDIAALLAG